MVSDMEPPGRIELPTFSLRVSRKSPSGVQPGLASPGQRYFRSIQYRYVQPVCADLGTLSAHRGLWCWRSSAASCRPERGSVPICPDVSVAVVTEAASTRPTVDLIWHVHDQRAAVDRRYVNDPMTAAVLYFVRH